MLKLDKTKDIKQISMTAATPEKAGVGGSIPSLATITFQTVTCLKVAPDINSGVPTESSRRHLLLMLGFPAVVQKFLQTIAR